MNSLHSERRSLWGVGVGSDFYVAVYKYEVIVTESNNFEMRLRQWAHCRASALLPYDADELFRWSAFGEIGGGPGIEHGIGGAGQGYF